jgi:fibronectin type 3 domain-containing protein
VKKTSILLTMVIAALAAGVIGFITFHSKPGPHAVTLAWHESAPVPGVKVTKYYIYRSTTPGGPYVKIGSSTQPQYVDSLVQSGRTYYYAVTAVDAHDHESKKSLEATATIPN